MKRAASAAVVAWAWYSVLVLGHQEGGSTPGLVRAGATERAFWAAWWTEDPRRGDADPDACGFVEGRGLIHGEAVGAADAALRAARGPHVFGRSLGESFARAAYREGAPRVRACVADFGALAADGYAELGLAPGATPAELAAAFRARHPDLGGAAVDMERLTKLYRAARADAQRRLDDEARAQIAAGAEPVRRKRRAKASEPEQGELNPLAREYSELGERTKVAMDTVARVLLKFRAERGRTWAAD